MGKHPGLRWWGAGILWAVCVFCLAGCDSPQRTLEGLRQEVGAYASEPSREGAVRIEEGFIRLDQQIEALRAGGKEAEARALREERDRLKARFVGAQVSGSLQDLRQAAEKIGRSLQEAGKAISVPRGTPDGE